MESIEQELGQWKHTGALTSLEQNRFSKAGENIIQKHMGALRELAKEPEE